MYTRSQCRSAATSREWVLTRIGRGGRDEGCKLPVGAWSAILAWFAREMHSGTHGAPRRGHR
jgi:hypothetical protein